jgi:drug/metabolite transporter (DMT)-like permease
MTRHDAGAQSAAHRRRQLAWVLLWLTPAMFAANQLAARVAPGIVEPYALAFGRWLLAAMVLLPFAWPQLSARPAALRREWPDFLVLGALGMLVCGAFVYIGGRTTTATNIGLIYGAVPVGIVLLARVLYREAVSRVQAAGIALCLAGLLAILARGEAGILLALRFTSGDLWIASAAASWALYSVLLKYRPTQFGQTARLVAIALGGLVSLLPGTVHEILSVGPPALDGEAIGLILLVALVPGVGAYWSYGHVLRELGAGRAGVMMYVGPLYTAILAWALLDERIEWYHFLGAALILPGLWLATRAPPRR